MKVYFISGLGADRRVFARIQLPVGYEIVHLDWMKPLKNESLQAMAVRLGAFIDHSSPFIVIGLSLGGMMATEIALRYKPALTILISSIPTAQGLPNYFRWAGKLKLHRLLPVSLLKSSAIIKHTLGPETKEDKDILYQMLHDSDPAFIRWAIGAVLQWTNDQYPHPYIHIHGTADRTFPAGKIRPTHIIKGAGHTLILNRIAEVNKILAKYLRPLPEQ